MFGIKSQTRMQQCRERDGPLSCIVTGLGEVVGVATGEREAQGSADRSASPARKHCIAPGGRFPRFCVSLAIAHEIMQLVLF